MTEAFAHRILQRECEVEERLQNHLLDFVHSELPDIGPIVIQEDTPRISDNHEFDLKVPLLCRDGAVVIDIRFDDMIQFLSRWSPSSSDCPTSEAVSEILRFLGSHCLPASVQDSGDIIIHDMIPIVVERCATKMQCANLIERMLWSHHVHNCAIGLVYGVCDPLVQDELEQYIETFFEDSRNVAVLLC
jgi:hypothetical protein